MERMKYEHEEMARESRLARTAASDDAHVHIASGRMNVHQAVMDQGEREDGRDERG